MAEHVERLKASHFEEAMTFLNQAFAVHGPHDFARLLPGLYQPDDEHMGHNLALRRDGHLLGIVGVFPITLLVGSERLRVAGVGGVSVAPDRQGQGLLEKLMQTALETIESGGYELSYLIGPRQRYRRFGWEVTGSYLRFAIEQKNLEHAFRGRAAAELTLDALGETPDPELVRQLCALHDAQPLRAERSSERFSRLLRSWQREALVARDAQGAVLGYVSVDEKKRLIAELVASSAEQAIAIVRALGARWAGRLELCLPALPSPLTDELGRIAERVDLRASGNWLIRDLPAVAGAFLRARHAARALPAGRVVVQVGGSAERFELWVEDERAGCRRSSAPADFEASQVELMRALFGPLPPAWVGALPSEAALLSSWCPLPLALSQQDQV